MSAPVSPLSLRLPEALRQALDDVARRTRRSRSWVVQEALKRHLQDIAPSPDDSAAPLDRLMALSGAGRKATPRSRAEIDAHVRWLRDNG